ncbi:bifunctional non-homologous end joining protein LigD [Anseongella ginsenosidimutans]|uniref:DNA ligase (ATP) n=1 Tax=Anseongella ginsenosidimutans TaxID=496056 RepID=A0A4R3KQU4_9SPHI|nr:DNA ligase D [Anseongella ginsenosidimutans]QEC52907.1 DNA ligase D [Anseongella ginsenosidimutans]TCS87298.1 bifunctional non-homologous end joining protein LigD [Anseongella ginsenosidimutans]
MSLTTYRKKRSFKDSPEPKPKREGKNARKEDKKLRFVVQRHHASRLHYDFRLEMEGVLKSWAVPKGPSLNPSDKRLAMMVEDHPYDYKDFEGIIPEGNYGAGVVYKWDEGFYEPLDKSANPEKELLKELRSGSLKFLLKGKKLKGEFALVKMKGAEDNSWLLIKHKDKFSTETPYNSEDQVPAAIKEKKNNRKKSGASRRPAGEETKRTAARASAADFIKPMLATLIGKPFSREGWLFENKWDGYRAIAEVSSGAVRLYSRSGKSFNKDYEPIAGILSEIEHDLVLDGEIVALNKQGKPEFQLLQNYKKSAKGTLVYYVFDLLEFKGYDLKSMELFQRKELLNELFNSLGELRSAGTKDARVQNTEYVINEGEKYFKKILREKGEGLLAKSGSSSYQPGRRSDQWLKIKTHQRQEAIIAGFTDPRESRKKFGALILAVNENGKLKYIGHTGGGFNQESLNDVYEKMRPLIQDKSPFDKKPKTNAPVTWLKPELVCEVKFAEWTNGGHMRQPIFIALREDKAADMIVHEKPVDPEDASANKGAGKAENANEGIARKARKGASKKANAVKGDSAGKESSPAGAKSGKSLQLKAGNRNITISNPGKLYWPREKISKGDLVAYYQEMSGYLLPYLKDRPQSLHRHPDGITKAGFFQKDFDLKNAPEWIKTVPIHSESNNKEIDYLVCNNEATLLYMANLGCIEINPWLSRSPRIDFPDYIAIDLDPEKISFSAVIEAALAVKEVLDNLELGGFCKTSGATGLHIYIPLTRRYNFEVTRIAAQFIAQKAHELLPAITSLVRSPSKRQKKIYLDYLQNTRGQTLAAPYSARPRPQATVSAPLNWAEVNEKLNPGDFTIHTIGNRVKQLGDLWEATGKTKNSLSNILKASKS